MDFIKEWITNIILFVLLATVVDMLLPNSSFQKYTKMVTGLLLIAIILSPILKLISNDFETAIASIPNFSVSGEKNMENLIDLQKKEIQAGTSAYILKQMAVQLEKDADKELMEQYGLEIAHIELQVNEGTSKEDILKNLQSIVVHLKSSENEAEAVEVVKKIEIDTDQPLPSKDHAKEVEQVATLLSDKWDVDQKIIEITIEGGNT